jgi:hypothetical protein
MRFFHRARRGPERVRIPPIDEEAVGWIRTHRRPFHDYSVGTLVPVAFERYVRLLHPARAVAGAPVRWDAVAAWSGRTIHALAQWEFLERPVGIVASMPPFNEPPPTGGLPPASLARLLEVLTAHTGTPDHCFIGVWEGYGWLDRADPGWDRELALDQRTFLMRPGPIDGASGIGWAWPNDGFAQEPPTIIWPADRAWFVASDVDLDSTYVGGTSVLAAALIDHPDLEAWPVEPGDDVSIGSDAINAS